MISPQEALEKLIAGNERFAQNKSIHPNRFEETREVLLKQQKPFVAVLSCSDSRVPIEIIFDAGLGDIFSVRTAGHVLSKEVLGSLEYAVKTLGVKLVIILGHENCGAIRAAIETQKDDSKISENLKAIMEHIYPAIESSECIEDSEDFLHCAVVSNIKYQLRDLLKKDEYLAQKVKTGEIMLKGALYNLATGKVELVNGK
ncbi:MAG TPA: carbonic anhydrase [Candidatus Gastranaerophilaceae bacterium]|nr:carbonic anhydrase [Candidatus Gastranaerophilaceae bacterium]HPT41791.1 carbonic anhydrase [Candidatus Gastranaerophilaceae bacterium]